METKSLVRVLKMQRGRYSKNPNAEAEKKVIEGIIEKNGGKLEVVAALNEAGEKELVEYVKSVMGIVKVKPSKAKEEKYDEYAESSDGKLYKIDSVKKTCKRVLKDLSELSVDDLSLPEMNLQVYQRYLKDHFEGETCTLKKGKLLFKGYRISCDVENGFMVEDTTKKYEVVETGFEGIPTPKELGEWFKKPRVEHTPEQLQEAIERGKELARKAKEEKERNDREESEEEGPDFEKLCKKVLMLIRDARSKTIDVDPEKFTDMIPFKRWKRKVKSLYSQWKERKIRYAKFLNEIETLTKEETFVVEEKKHRSSFVGTLLPEHETVGTLKGNKIEVDGKWIDAVPFLLEYLLFYEKKAMSQIMKYAAGEITDVELIKNPIDVDWKVEYNKRALKNTPHNAQVLTMVYSQVDLVAPQDLLYEADLEVGDKILIDIDGELKTRTIASVTKGITLGKEIGLLKLDKWIKLPKKLNN